MNTEKIKEIKATIEQLQQQVKELEKPFTPVKGMWYWIKQGPGQLMDALANYQSEGWNCYGFNHGGDWTNSYCGSSINFCAERATPANDSEVKEALINEAKFLISSNCTIETLDKILNKLNQ